MAHLPYWRALLGVAILALVLVAPTGIAGPRLESWSGAKRRPTASPGMNRRFWRRGGW